MGNKSGKKAPPEPTAPPLPLEVDTAVGVGLAEKDYGKPYRFSPFSINSFINKFSAAMQTAQ